ncbi:acetylornithine transaminase [Brevibacterium jeotgali]|uniref:Acetylornithine aminotransferase apoenzyme n=1 Tax=Brevibacterium jeotgali TaxID=1262550 RepID=A0A2H1L392_9MICO|nr:acetylornithine transaminase [Brevibacterium jeotgali]TWC02573.1 acetylornithine aminotransferase [Brevibacterium jeotgali]SMY11366.1 acetylornithine aminotransferase apoenzyme [Brevibacterium jeotgali]
MTDTEGTGMMTGTSEWRSHHEAAILPALGRPQRLLVRGEGALVWDETGAQYVDLLAGIAVNALGHAHPAIVEALTAQASTLGHISNFFASPPQIALAERILALASAPVGSSVYFSNSGAEANEAALKITRRTGRSKIVAVDGSFHGRTMGALALTAKTAYREPFEPGVPGVVHVPFGDEAALRAAVDADTAAVVLEPIQGESGVRRHPAGYLTAAREATDSVGALLVLDEVQTGIGRTGSWFAFQDPHIGEGVTPDVITLAKGLGGGMPIGATLTFGDRVTGLLTPGQHGSTFSGNPLATAVGLAVLTTIQDEDLLARAADLGGRMRTALAALPQITEVSGAGLLIGMELRDGNAKAVAGAALDAGWIVNPVTETRLRIAPPLIITDDQLLGFADALPGLIASVAPGAADAEGGA